MRIHRIRLQDFRGVADREIAFRLDGVTIVEGPNEVGKSSVAEAIDLVLGTLDSSTAQRVKDVRPVGRDVGPRVEIEISTGPYRFTYAKRWLKQKETTLEVVEPRREHLAGRDAHERVEAMLAETMDAELWAALRLQQGSELDQAAFDTPALARALDAAAGGPVADDHDDDLLARIEAERSRYWTATGRPRSERVERQAAVAAAAQRVADLHEQLRRLDADAERAAALGRRLDDLAAQRRPAVVERDVADAAWHTAVAAQRDADRADEQRSVAVVARDAAAAALDRRHELVDDLRTAESELDKLDHERRIAAPRLDAVTARADVVAGEVAALDAEVATARGAVDAARRHLDHLRAVDELDEWRARHERVTAAEAALAAAQATVDATSIAPDLVADIEHAALVVAESAARLEVAGARITAIAHAPVTLEVDGVAEAAFVGVEREWVVPDRWTMRIDDAVTVVVEPGQGARDLARAAEVAQRTLDELCAAAGVSDPSEAQSRLEACREAERDAARARDTLTRDLGDLTPGLLAERVAGLAAAIDGEDEWSTGRPATIGAAGTAVAQAERTLAGLIADRDERASEERSHRATVEEARLEDRLVGSRLAHARERVATLAERLATARAAADDEHLEAMLATASDALVEAETVAAHAAAVLAAQEPDVARQRLDNAVGALERVDAAARDAADERRDLVTALEVRGEQGTASALEEARSELAHLEREHERIEARAASAELLFRTVEARRADARRRYADPFRRQIEGLGRIVFGPDVEVELDDDLRIARRISGGVALDFDQLSVGAREQLGLLARLACASIVSDDGGAPVIFDDVLGYTDPERLRTMGTAIAAASRGCQVIVLTCTPGRYAQVGNADVVVLS